MNKSKVYFCNLRTKPNLNLLDKLGKLLSKANFQGIDYNNKFTAIKIHFGEIGNLAYIRPNYVKKIVDMLKGEGSLPFLTDANTLYKGKRANAVDHLNTAFENGFYPQAVGCNVIIADGLKGTEYKDIEINQKHIKKAKIGSAVADADIVISVNHFKGHEQSGFGGAIKNLGMGAACIAGKLEQHSSSKPLIRQKTCIGCGVCIRNCSRDAISLDANKKAIIDYDKCTGCGQCIAMCMYDAAGLSWNETKDHFGEKMAEYTMGVLKDKPNFHISFIMNISPNCDCWSSNDVPIVNDIGIAASYDPVALDMACADMVNEAMGQKNSLLTDKSKNCDLSNVDDKFEHIHPGTNWRGILNYSEKIGLGTTKYEIEVVDG